MSRFDYRILLKNGVTAITAHSGCEGTAPNSREHILAAIACGAEIIEVDVRQQDDYLYLSHDLPEHPENCVKLADCFALVSAAENLSMNLDMKTAGLLDATLKLASQYGMCRRIVFTGEAIGCRTLANSYGADVWRNLREGETVADGIAAIVADGCPALNVHYSAVTPEINEQLRWVGHGFSAWTADTEDEMRRLLEMGVWNITTRKPALAMKLRRELQPKIDKL